MTLIDSSMEIQGTPQTGAMPKPRGSRQGKSVSKPQDMTQGEMKPDAGPKALHSQTFKDVDAWLEVYGKEYVRPPFKAEEILAIVSSFHAFSQEYRDALSKLIGPSRQDWLETAMDNALLDYWEPIVRAVEHHRSAQYRTLLKDAYAKLASLQDKLEERLRLRFDINIVLYFERIGKAMRYPFGNTYLIGIPLIDAYRGDWMAIPHELGHHVFWKARFSETDTGPVERHGTNFLQAELDSAMHELALPKENPAREMIQILLDDWTEEIFADVVGARIAGPVYIDAAWALISRKAEQEKDLFQSDGEHPILYLLPYIRAAALETSPQEQWDSLFQGIKTTELIPNKALDTKNELSNIQIKDLRSAVESYAKKITARLKDLELDKLLHGPSSVAELKEFIRAMRQESEQKVTLENKETEEQEILKLLLKPVILAKGQEWTCRNGHPNTSDNNTCPRCGEPRYRFWFLPNF